MRLCKVTKDESTGLAAYEELPVEFEDMRALKRRMRENPEEFEPGVYYTLVARRPLLKLKKELSFKVEES